MKKLTSSGKIFFGIITFVVIVLIVSKYQNSTQIKTFAYCLPECLPTELPIGYTTLTRNCYINQTECLISNQTANQNSNTAEVAIGFKDSIHKVQGIGTVTMLHLNIMKIYVRENNQTNWVTLLDGSKIFDVATLDNQTAIVADISIPPAAYTQEKIVLGNSDIKINSITFNIFNRTYSLYSSSNGTVLSYTFAPVLNQKNVLIFDLIVENSIKHTADGYFIYPQFNTSFSTIPVDQQISNSIFIS